MAKNIINQVRRIIGTDKVSIDIDDDANIIITDKVKKNLILYLRSIINSVEMYEGEENKEEVAFLYPKTLSTYKGQAYKARIELTGYKDEDYILAKFILVGAGTGCSFMSKKVFLAIEEARQLIKDLNV